MIKKNPDEYAIYVVDDDLLETALSINNMHI